MIDFSKPIRIVHNKSQKVRVLSTDLKSLYPIVLAVTMPEGLSESLSVVDKEGKRFGCFEPYVENIPDKITTYHVLYRSYVDSHIDVSRGYDSEESAAKDWRFHTGSIKIVSFVNEI